MDSNIAILDKLVCDLKEYGDMRAIVQWVADHVHEINDATRYLDCADDGEPSCTYTFFDVDELPHSGYYHNHINGYYCGQEVVENTNRCARHNHPIFDLIERVNREKYKREGQKLSKEIPRTT